MIKHLIMWKVYFDNITNNSFFINVFVLSLVLSSVFYLLFRRSENLKLKINFLAMHIILLFFPFVFSAVLWRCMMPILNCSPKMLIFFGPIAGILAIIFGFAILPYVYGFSDKNHLIENGWIKDFVSKQSKKLVIKEPEVYSINYIKPVAYSITNLKPSVFVSVGLSELLTKKEIEAVLLHELYHHKSKAYFWKFSMNALRIFTPLSTFNSASEQMLKEEIQADKYAISVQKTERNLLSAKRKFRRASYIFSLYDF